MARFPGTAMARWSQHIFRPNRRVAGNGRVRVDLLPGEGVGPEVTEVARRVLDAVEAAGLAHVEVRVGAPGPAPVDAIAAFCAESFAAGGAVLAGPYGGRVVYDLRARFDLFCKLSPLVPSPALRGASRLKETAGVDVLVVRENRGGVYQGEGRERRAPEGGRVVDHTFRYAEPDVRRLLAVAARLAAERRGRLAVIGKPGGVPGVTALWRDCAEEVAGAEGVACELLDVDYAAYRLVQQPASLDVVAAPNLMGDVLCDLGAVLLGSRGLSFGGSFAAAGEAIYQTNHGAAHDLAGTGRANPVGHVLALAMLLRESHGLEDAAAAVESAVEAVWRRGVRTDDLAEPGCARAGTAELGERIAAAVARPATRRAAPRLVR